MIFGVFSSYLLRERKLRHTTYKLERLMMAQTDNAIVDEYRIDWLLSASAL